MIGHPYLAPNGQTVGYADCSKRLTERRDTVIGLQDREIPVC